MHIRAAALALTATLVPFAAYAQDPPASPHRMRRPGRRRRPRRPRAGAADPALRPRHHQGREVRRPASSPSTASRTGSTTRFRRTQLGQGVSLGQPDRQDDARRRLRRPGGRQPRRAMGAARQSRPPAQRLLRHRRRSPTPIAQAVEAANNDPILMAFNIEALGKDDAPVIEVTRLFTTDVPEFSGRDPRARADLRRDALVRRARRLVPGEHRGRSDAHLQQSAGRRPAGAAPAPARPAAARHRVRPGSASVVMHYSMVQAAREADDAAAVRRARRLLHRPADGLRPATSIARRSARYITRWRLEKKDPERGAVRAGEADRLLRRSGDADQVGAVSEEGHRDWQPAFEAAGFKNAIIAKEAPTPEQDPDWSPEDARYSVIRWLPSTTENASGPHIHDPRTGEILEADIQFYHNVMNLARDWYFVQVGPLDPRAQTAAAARRSDGTTDRVRRRARGRPHARLPAQHEGQLDVSGRARCATASG